ncbi:hypothetical protein HYH03_017737 [Edaphochlamys debaryana]|uniref:phytol kinase n=1 Tax=Edaphochlamys debaryana TaxID=47281 RepID=A0A836BNU9_9CHLO|nr:hypothetical protein HYH03_017737 [Edaphochlamys debaryana]|eukprot:KAG2483385.1 hypothetical protein HYH03_017737 [Edaphochlamys debaryana]
MRGKDGSVPRALDASELDELLGALTGAYEAMRGHAGHAGEEAFLTDDHCIVGIQQLAAVSYRQPLPDLFNAEAEGVEQLKWRVGIVACRLTNALLCKDLSSQPAAAAGQFRFARGLLQTHAIPAAARQLATLADTARSSAGPLSPGLFKAVADYPSTTANLAGYLLSLSVRSSKPDLTRDVLAAVADSSFMEHAGRLVLLLRGSRPPGIAHLRQLASSDQGFAYAYVKACDAVAASTTPSWGAVTGPCARHAAMVVGLTALGELEGEGLGGAACACLEPRLSHWGKTIPLWALARALDPVLPAPPRPITATRLLLRLGFAAARSGGQPGEAPVEAAGAGAGSSSGSGGPVELSSDLVRAGFNALSVATRQLEAHLPWRGPWLGGAADAWRLAAALLMPAGAGSSDANWTSLGSPVWSLLLNCASLTGRFCFAAEPPPAVAAALAGGALPLLERLLRRAGEAPEGLEAAAVAGLQDPLSFGWTLPLLAYGEPVQAAAFVATVIKLLRRAAARGVFPLSTSKGYSVLHDVLFCTQLGTTDPSGTAPPVALSRLGLVLSLALSEWLPVLSRLALQGAAEDEAAWREEQEQRQGAGEQRGTDGEAACTKLQPLFWSFIVALAIPQMQSTLCATLSPAADEVSAAAGSGGAGGSGNADGACARKSSQDSNGGGMEWPLTEVQVEVALDLVGAALRLLQRRRPDPSNHRMLYANAGAGALFLAAMHPREVRALAASGSSNAWRPEAVREVTEVVRRMADDCCSGGAPDAVRSANALATLVRHLDALASQLGRGRPAGREMAASDPLAAALAPLVVSPAEARRRLGVPPACSNPACANLAGDSEAGLRLQRCGRCGQASYCCRDCQTAHWKAGHKEACGGSSGGGSKAG